MIVLGFLCLFISFTLGVTYTPVYGDRPWRSSEWVPKAGAAFGIAACVLFGYAAFDAVT